jgi:hypothetical protein
LAKLNPGVELRTGEHRRQGDITKTGNGHARRMLIEAAWNYRFPARISRALQIRQEGQSKAVRNRAQLRLAHRYRRLSSRKCTRTNSASPLRARLSWRQPELTSNLNPRRSMARIYN